MDELNRCTKCGKYLEEQWAYCPGCGTNTGGRKLTKGKWGIERYLTNEFPTDSFCRQAIHAYKIWASPPEAHTIVEIAKCVWRETDATAISYVPAMIRYIKSRLAPMRNQLVVDEEESKMLAFIFVNLEDEPKKKP